MDEEEWKATFKEAEKTYQEDLVKYTDEIKLLKKDNFEKQRLITKLNKMPETIYPFIINVKDKIKKIEDKFNEIRPKKAETPTKK